jgi:autotransporter passenger strand-loop-strand repeat protein
MNYPAASSGVVHSGGTANNTTIGDATGYFFIFKDGVASNTKVLSGLMTISSGGTTDKTTVFTELRVSSGGMADNTTISSGFLNVYSDGTANRTTVNSNGSLTIHNGGTANITTVKSKGVLAVSEGGIANSTTISSGGMLRIDTACTVNSTTISSGGSMNVLQGASANIITVNAGGKLFVSSGGTATQIKENGGYVNVNSKAVITYAPNTFSNLTLTNGNVTVHSGTTANKTMIDNNVQLFIYDGGLASSTTVKNAYTFVSSGGTAEKTTVDANGNLTVYSSGKATSTTINTKGYLNISSGGTAVFDTVHSGGQMDVREGGRADSTTVSGGKLYVLGVGASGFCPIVSEGGLMEIKTGGKTTSAIVSSGGSMVVSDMGSATLTKVEVAGYLLVEAGGSVSNTSVFVGDIHVKGTADTTTVNTGSMYVSGGGKASNTVLTKAVQYVYEQGMADKTTVNDDCRLSISGGVAQSAAVYGGRVYVYTGGLLDQAAVHDSGEVRVYSGGTVNATTVSSGGKIYVASGGTANKTILSGGETGDKGGMLQVSAFGVANSTTVSGGGRLHVYSGGTLNETSVFSGGSLHVHSVGVQSGATVYANGTLFVSQGGKLTGKLNLKAGADVTVNSGTIIFDITQTAAGAEAFVNNLSLVKGAPKYTLTVSNTLADGTYNLAEGAAGFTKSITVKDTSGETLGTIKVGGETLSTEFADYTLTLTGSTLAVTVGVNVIPDTGAPVVTKVEADIVTTTRQDVTVTVEFEDDVAVTSISYKIDDGTWQNYTGGVTVSKNAKLSFKAADAAGHESDIVEYEVTNIDKEPPAKPTATADETDPTNGIVTVTASFSGDTAVKEYSLDGTNWGTYPGGVKFDNNGKVYFRGTDAVGNVSEPTEYVVANIDKEPPAAPTASADITTETSGVVKVTAIFSEDSAVKEYSTDGLMWQDYTAPVELTENGIVYFRAADAAGNESGIISYEVTNIHVITPDTTPPVVKNAKANITTPTNQNVIVTAEFTDNIGISTKEYKFEGESDDEWKPYSDAGVTVSKNTTVYFKAIDTAGNESEVVSYKVSNIDKVKPAAPTATADITTPTNGIVTVTATFSGDSEKKEYSFDGTNWAGYPGKVTVNTNGKVYFRGIDAAGNASDWGTYDVTNITASTIEPEPELVNGPDDITNNWLYNKSGSPAVNPALSKSAGVAITKAGAVQIDQEKTVSRTFEGKAEPYRNFVGTGDDTDYVKITLLHGAKLSFNLDSTDAAKLAICQITSSTKKGVTKYSMKTVQTTVLKAAGDVNSKPLLLNPGEYYLMVQSTNGAKKDGVEAFYNVTVNSSSEFFDKGNNGDDWSDMKTAGKASTTLVDFGVLSDSTTTVLSGEWVGFGDAVDYRKFTLNGSAKLSFTVTTNDTVKVGLYQLVPKEKGGVTTYSLKQVQATTFKSSGDTKSLLVGEGDYYLMVQSTNAKKGGAGADYSVALNKKASEKDGLPCTEFFPETLVNDNWKDMKTLGAADPTVGTFGSAKVKSTDTLSDWVGYGDAIDYKGFNVNEGTQLVFEVHATGASKFTVYELVPKTKSGKTTYSLKALQSRTLVEDDAGNFQCATAPITFENAGTYYFSMESTNAKKGGSAYYDVTVGILGGSSEAALSMPETDSLGISDALSFGGYDADVLADASASSLAELNDKSGWMNICMLA